MGAAMTDRELMQQALDALEAYARNCNCEGGGAPCDAAKALRARLAQPEREIESDQDHVEDDGCPTEKAVLQRFWREHQAQPEQEQCHHKFEVDQEAPSHSCCQMCGEVRKQPEQEPVAWRQWVEGNPKLRGHWMLADPDVKDKCLPQGDWQPLYTAPPQREWQGLTDEEIRGFEIWLDEEEEKHGWNPPADIVKYIEAKLKEKNHG